MVLKDTVEKAIEKNNGILYLRPCWVARDFLPPGKRLGLKDEQYDMGERGFITERWFGAENTADNAVGPPDEGLAYLDIEGEDILLKDAVAACGPTIMGGEYAKTHKTLGRLPKIFDYTCRTFFHFHQMEKDANKVGMKGKDEAYYFLDGEDVGAQPDTYFGVHPYIVEQNKQNEIFLPYLKNWDGDDILKHSKAYLNVPGEGFHVPAGIPHAPGTALTLEIQEPSDVFAVFQAKANGMAFSKSLLWKDITKEDREKYGEQVVLDQVNWELSGDPYFYENCHTTPILISETKQAGGFEEWIYYNTTKFSGKKVTVRPGASFKSVDKGVYNVFVWRGKGKIAGHEVEARNFGIDEVLVTHEKAVNGFSIENTGSADLVLFKFFGPEINMDIPYIEKHG
jgi:hypothetical protein